MDLYGDLPPAVGEEAATVAESWSKPAGEAAAAAAPPSAPAPSAAMKPRTVQPPPRPGTRPAADPTPSKKPAAFMAFKPRQTVSTAVKAAVLNENQTAAKQNAQSQSADKPALRSITPTKAYTFEVDGPYDPSRPNDYIEHCQERLDAKKRALLEEENRQEMEARRQERQRVEEERAAALAAGDMGRVQASLGRGRGRGSLSNLPAWMTGDIGLDKSSAADAPSDPRDRGGLDVAKDYMSRMGYEEGSGLGKSNQGISRPVEVTRTAGGQAVVSTAAEDAARLSGAPPPDVVSGGITGTKRKLGVFTNPSRVVLLKNMVGPHEAKTAGAREHLQEEIRDECSSKYGPVRRCVVKDISDSHRDLSPPEEECVRCFVSFERQDSAVKAFRDLNNRFFGGRQIAAAFFEEDRFEGGDVGPSREEW